MRVLIWHVHGSWTTAFVSGPDTYLLPVVPDRGPQGRGRARTWDWPDSVQEVTPPGLAEADIDVVILQRPAELELLARWTGRRAGEDLPAIYVEHNAPYGGGGRHPAVSARHPLAERSDIPVVHVTHFNQLMWDCGAAPTRVIEHGIPDPGPRYTGELERLGVVVNEPARRDRVVGTDVLLALAARLPIEVFGMQLAGLADRGGDLALHEDLPQPVMHELLARDRAYLHPYRWTSLGLALLEAMALGMPVLALATTAVPEVVPPEAGVVSNDVEVLATAARRLLADPAEARERGQAARAHVLARFALERFCADWQVALKEAR